MKPILLLIAAYFKTPAKPTAAEVRAANLAEYERLLITEEAAAAYHTKMAEYYREGITRLRSQQTYIPSQVNVSRVPLHAA